MPPGQSRTGRIDMAPRPAGSWQCCPESPIPSPFRSRSPDGARRSWTAVRPACLSARKGSSKADFIAAARRAAQAAAQESARVEQEEESTSKSFLSRFKGSKKAKTSEAEEVHDDMPLSAQPADKLLQGLNRKERRAAIAEAARKAKQVKDLASAQAVRIVK